MHGAKPSPTSPRRQAPAALLVIALAALLAAAPSAAADGQASDTATVAVTISVQPFAEVTLDLDVVDVVLPPGPGNAEPVYVGGNVRTNVPASVWTRITAPTGAPGNWVVEPEVHTISAAGSYRFDQLMRIIVYDLPDGFAGETYPVSVAGLSASDISEIVKPGAGVATVTVIPD